MAPPTSNLDDHSDIQWLLRISTFGLDDDGDNSLGDDDEGDGGDGDVCLWISVTCTATSLSEHALMDWR